MRWLRKWMSQWWHRCMDGRYGLDGLSALCLCICATLLGCGWNVPSQRIRFGTFLCAAVLGIYGLYRCFSRDVQKHQRQWDSIERKLDEIDYRISLHTGVWKIRHSYRYVRCENCGHRFRVPRKRKRQETTCPNCKHRFIKRM